MGSRHPEPISGILNTDKPAGMTSHDVVAAVRRITGEKRVGHAGTLDPMATGVLLVCFGQATRVTEYLMDSPKRYRAGIVLGIATDTYDAEGDVTHRNSNVSFTCAQIEEALSSFVGRIEQLPPLYSAIKHQGVPLYKLARRGIVVERKPRFVEVYDIKLIDWSWPSLTIEVECSKGTYIRSLAHDLGEKLGCGAHLRELVRLASGRFTLEDALTLEEFAESFSQGRWRDLLHPIDEALLGFDAMVVDRDAEYKIRHGQQIEGKGSVSTALCRAYSPVGDFIGLLERDPRTGLWQPRKVFSN